MVSKSIILKTKKYYEKKLKSHGNNFKGMNWSSKKSQYIRFAEIIKNTNLANKSIHDVGCGNGEFLNYLIKKKVKYKDYLGSDISTEMIDLSKRRFKKNKKNNFVLFSQKKYLNSKKFDYVISSGLFNVKNNFSNKKWEAYIFKMIALLFKRTRKCLIINFLTFDVEYKDKNLFYMSVDRLVAFIRKNLSKKIVINHQYNLWEYTIEIYR